MQNTNAAYKDGDMSNANFDNNQGTSAARNFMQFDTNGMIRNNPLLNNGDNNY